MTHRAHLQQHHLQLLNVSKVRHLVVNIETLRQATVLSYVRRWAELLSGMFHLAAPLNAVL